MAPDDGGSVALSPQSCINTLVYAAQLTNPWGPRLVPPSPFQLQKKNISENSALDSNSKKKNTIALSSVLFHSLFWLHFVDNIFLFFACFNTGIQKKEKASECFVTALRSRRSFHVKFFLSGCLLTVCF